MGKESPRSTKILSLWKNNISILSPKNLMYLTHRYVSEIGTVPTVYDLFNVIVGVYSVYDKSSGNFPFITLIEYSSMGTCSPQFST